MRLHDEEPAYPLLNSAQLTPSLFIHHLSSPVVAPLRVTVTDDPEHILVVLTEMEEAATGIGSTVIVTLPHPADQQPLTAEL